MAVIRLASFSGGGGVGIRAGRAFSQQYHDTLMYGWEFLGDPTVEVPQELLSRIEYLPDEDEDNTEYGLTNSERRKWLAAFAKEYAHSEHLRELCEYAFDDLDYPIENPQVEDDEEKEVVESTTESSEDTHGGSEATKSIEDSPSSADDGEEEKITPHQKETMVVIHLVNRKILTPTKKKVMVLGLNPRKEKVLVLRKIPMPIKKVRALGPNLVMVKKKVLVPVLVAIPARSPTR